MTHSYRPHQVDPGRRTVPARGCRRRTRHPGTGVGLRKRVRVGAGGKIVATTTARQPGSSLA
ncbi:MAG TPA: hypothetical protein VNP92_13915 [Actinophytocola sp.]|nr:hypothetical protein [Actinophytocola sp.]